MTNGGVPFVVTYRKILRKPKIRRERKFVGTIQLVKNLLVKAIETVEKAAFETTTEYEDPGQSVAVHWALTVEDPFDTRPGQEKNLVAYRMMDDIPPNGLHFEVYMPQPKPMADLSPEEATGSQSGPQTNLVHDLTPEQFDLLRRRQQNELLRDTRGVNGRFQRPSDAAYSPRPVKTIDEEAVEGAADEESADLDGAGGLGEDN
jgi:hypothetical protein